MEQLWSSRLSWYPTEWDCDWTTRHTQGKPCEHWNNFTTYRQVSNIRRTFEGWSLRCNWSIAYRRCSNYIFILDLTPGFNIWREDNCKPRRVAFNFWDLVSLILEILWYALYDQPFIWDIRCQPPPICINDIKLNVYTAWLFWLETGWFYSSFRVTGAAEGVRS